MTTPLDPETHSLVGWIASGAGGLGLAIVSYLYKRLRKLNEIETGQIIAAELLEFEHNRLAPSLSKLEGRVSNVEKLEARLGAIQSNVANLADKVSDLQNAVEKNAITASRELTGAMNRLDVQRKEDKEIQLERLDGLKELLEAKIK